MLADFLGPKILSKKWQSGNRFFEAEGRTMLFLRLKYEVFGFILRFLRESHVITIIYRRILSFHRVKSAIVWYYMVSSVFIFSLFIFSLFIFIFIHFIFIILFKWKMVSLSMMKWNGRAWRLCFEGDDFARNLVW